MRAPDPALIERFRRDLEALTDRSPSPARMLGLAVSGGSDSIAMLLLAAAAYPGAIRAATVNHGLRPEAANEAALVAELCTRLEVPHALLSLPPGWKFPGNLQNGARTARYQLLQRWAGQYPGPRLVQWIAVAHQRNDVAEGFLMRARRGSGVGGLAAMPRSRSIDHPFDGGPLLVRPLLDWSRGQLAAIVAAAGVGHAEDPSNADPRFDRSRVRTLIETNPDLPVSRLALAAQNLRHAEDALEWYEQREAKARFEEDEEGDLWLDPADLPYELRRRLLWRAIQGIRQENGIFDDWRASGLARLLAELDGGRGGTIAGVQARVIGERWHFRLAPPRRSH